MANSSELLKKKLEEVEYLLRYYSVVSDSQNILQAYSTAIGQMGEAHRIIEELMISMDESEPIPAMAQSLPSEDYEKQS